jgi:hypothetical protein
MNELIPIERIENRIHLIRGQKVMLSRDLAELYEVKTFILNQAVRRNIDRFPPDFMFKLSWTEVKALRSQFVILDERSGRGQHAKYPPLAFTEQGIAMLSGILHSPRAVKVNIAIMRAFVRLRQVLAANRDLAYLFKELKYKVDQHDTEIGLIIRTIEKMIAYENKPKTKIGFHNKKEE